jgi:hypothetical protein
MDGNAQFADLSAKVATVVAAHHKVHADIAEHGKAHAKRRYEARAKAETESNLMKDIPEGGIK